MKNTFLAPIVPSNDEERLNALYRYEVLDTPPEGAFNHIAELAVKIFKVPIALVSLVDREQVHFKANVGMPGTTHTNRGVSLCSLAVMQKEPVIFEDAKNEPCLMANPLVAGSFGLRFYAGAQLVTSDGYNIGTLCIIDKEPRKFTEDETEMLKNLASIVIDEMEIRISAIKASRAQSQLMHIAAHDLKSPVQAIQALTELFEKETSNELKEKYGQLIRASTAKMTEFINRLVRLSEIENNQFSLDLKDTDSGELAEEVVSANTTIASQKCQHIILEKEVSHSSLIDPDWMREVFDNLINNAVKYSPKGKSIRVKLKANLEGLFFEVQDEGPGFSEEDKTRAFGKFSRLSATPTGGESSTGLGLSIVKMLTELHGGTVEIESEGKNRGSKMVVKIPASPGKATVIPRPSEKKRKNKQKSGQENQ